ncbi:hypothetical protein AORI_2944 [Amycolatopsis keratiniphila]|uniref:Uncharacterized protein n=1 Tax=Amycolatopsis keratiniphila TaxID=129921 RepID=R4SSG6_9PSEU|nr:hypothetical protein AORI_2944 [Amycolatopsis keratiniphila]
MRERTPFAPLRPPVHGRARGGGRGWRAAVCCESHFRKVEGWESGFRNVGERGRLRTSSVRNLPHSAATLIDGGLGTLSVPNPPLIKIRDPVPRRCRNRDTQRPDSYIVNTRHANA